MGWVWRPAGDLGDPGIWDLMRGRGRQRELIGGKHQPAPSLVSLSLLLSSKHSGNGSVPGRRSQALCSPLI